MPSIDLVVETAVSRSPRARQLEAMFDVPPAAKCTLSWKGELPIDGDDWNVGLIVGPSGSGKTVIAQRCFGEHFQPQLKWEGASVVDDFAKTLPMDRVAAACQAVGFNTIPAWLRPYSVLSNGEKFRVELARRLVELPDPVVVDEFTSVVDRQVAQIGAHAVQKFIRREKRKFVACSCHYDIIEWLQPDWIFEPATMHFARRGLCQRPRMEVSISRVPYSAWSLFAPFHYMTNKLHTAARCFCLFVGDRPAAFAGVLHRPHPRVRDIMGISRLVTLPDWQGLGLAMILCDRLAEAYKGIGKRLHMYPAHPALIRSFDKSKMWAMTKRPGEFSSRSTGSARFKLDSIMGKQQGFGGRASAVFEYAGPSMPEGEARMLLER